ncbi:hippocalcin-like protein 1 isoform X2 [Nematostella vectensis]|nr:hippocalcin-like protein 1 isoform X2 [Nematostella vectensis]
MGNKKSKLRPEDLHELMSCTHFSSREIQDWYRGFMKSCPTGYVTLQEFQNMYAEFFDGDASNFALHVFRTFDDDRSGRIDFKEFMSSLSVTSRGNLDEKLEWAFRIYDINNDGSISRMEMIEIIEAVRKMHACQKWPARVQSSVECTDRIMRKYDIDGDGLLSLEEFKAGVIEDPFLVMMLQYKVGRSNRSSQIDSSSDDDD